VIAAGHCSAGQGKGPQTPAPCPAPHPRLRGSRTQHDFAELDTHNSKSGSLNGCSESRPDFLRQFSPTRFHRHPAAGCDTADRLGRIPAPRPSADSLVQTQRRSGFGSPCRSEKASLPWGRAPLTSSSPGTHGQKAEPTEQWRQFSTRPGSTSS
jgi:hypothetical protein